jgi:hypothetical protein
MSRYCCGRSVQRIYSRHRANIAGWALTLLSTPNLSYASTAQTIGIGVGNALSFTVFLAFNSPEFS